MEMMCVWGGGGGGAFLWRFICTKKHPIFYFDYKIIGKQG